MKKVLALMGWWAKHIDDVWPQANFSKLAELTDHLPKVETSKAVKETMLELPARRVLKKVPSEPAADPPAAAEKKDAAAAATAVGQPVTTLRRVTFNCPLPGNAGFRKDVKGGTMVKVVEIGGTDPQKLGKLLVEAQLMVKGEDMAVTGWVAADAVATEIDPGDSVEDADAQLLPLAISKDEGGPKGSHCEVLSDWTELLDADTIASQYCS